MFWRFIQQFCRSFRQRRQDPPIETLQAVSPEIAWTLKHHDYHRVSDIQAASSEDLAAIPCLSDYLAVAIHRDATGEGGVTVQRPPSDDEQSEADEVAEGNDDGDEGIVIEAGGVDMREWC